MNPTVLLTGATGFVGRQILNALTAQSVEVKIVARKQSIGDLVYRLPSGNIVLTEDMCAEGQCWWEKACEGIDTVIHAAWYAEPGLYLKSTKNLDCLSATLTFAKACAAQGVRRFVGIGTCFEYDLSHEFLAVDTQLRPTSPYAAAKAAAYFALEQYFFSAEVEFAWCRLFYLYGEGEDSRRLVAYVRGRLEAGESVDLTSGEQVRDFLDVAVAGEMIVDLARSSEVGAVNVCSAIPVTVRELVEKIADEYGRRDLLRFGVRKDERFDPNIVVGVTSGSA